MRVGQGVGGWVGVGGGGLLSSHSQLRACRVQFCEERQMNATEEYLTRPSLLLGTEMAPMPRYSHGISSILYFSIAQKSPFITGYVLL